MELVQFKAQLREFLLGMLVFLFFFLFIFFLGEPALKTHSKTGTYDSKSGTEDPKTRHLSGHTGT